MKLSEVIDGINKSFQDFYKRYPDYSGKIVREAIEIVFENEPLELFQQHPLSVINLRDNSVEIQHTVYVTESLMLDDAKFDLILFDRDIRIESRDARYDHRIETVKDMILRSRVKPKSAIALGSSSLSFLKVDHWETIYE